MDIFAIREWNSKTDEDTFTLPAGYTLYQGHIKVEWEAFTGTKPEFWKHWEKSMSQYSDSQQNDALSSMISRVCWS